MDPHADPPNAVPLLRTPDRMIPSDTGLLVVDVQSRFLDVMASAARIVFNVRRLIEAAQALGVQAAATEQWPEKMGGTLPEIAQLLGSAIYRKTSFSAGTCGELFAAWRASEIERVLLCGIETHVCVQQTALDLLANGYQVVVAVDAVGSRFDVDRDVALRRLEGAGAALTSTEAAIFEWCEDAARPEFRTISALAKRIGPSL